MPLSGSIRARLRYQHETIRELTADLSEAQLRKRIDPAKWSAHENIAHLACYQPVFLKRLHRMAAEAKPFFPRYVAEEDADFGGYVAQPTDRLLERIGTDREKLISLLEGLDEEGLQRAGLHARYGEFPLVRWAEFFLLHEAHHLYTIFMIVQELRRELP